MLRDFYIGEGGLLHRLEAITHLTTLPRQLVTVLSITWLPVVLIGLLTEEITGHVDPIIHDVSLHVRLLVATPVFLILDRVFPRSCHATLQQLTVQGFVPDSEEPRVERLLEGATRLARAMFPELAFALLGVALGVAALSGIVPIGGLTLGSALTASQVWYALVNWPLFQFLLWRSIWRWAIWARILIGLSRVDLALVPAHPDCRAGIRFLSQPSVDYCAMVLFAISSVLCAEWSGRLVFTTVRSFEPYLLAFAVAGILIAFGPLLFFTLPLMRARRAGLAESAGAATACARRLRREWIEERDPEAPPPADLKPLAYVTEIYSHTAQRLFPVLFDMRDMILLLVATLLPVLAAMVAHIPGDDWRVLFGVLTGGKLP